jgi:hypothetical protein
MSLAEVTQTGLEITLGSKRYHVEPLTDQDHADLDSWVQSRFIDNARRSVPPDADKATFDRVVGLAMREALGLSWMYEPGRAVLRTIEGHAMLAYFSIRHRDPKVKVEELRAALYDLDALQFFKAVFRQVNGLKQAGEKEEEKPADKDPNDQPRPAN